MALKAINAAANGHLLDSANSISEGSLCRGIARV